MAEITVYYEGPIVTRKQAIARGLTLYFTGKPCKRGHVAQRRLKGDCLKCEAERNHSETHKQIARASDRKRYNAPERRAYMLALARTEAQKAKALVRRSTPEAKAARAAYAYAYYRSESGREVMHRGNLKYRLSEKGRAAARKGEKAARARKANAEGVFTVEDERKLRERQKHCHICGKRLTEKDPGEIDHVIALADGGKHDTSNIALAHRLCNARKGKRRIYLI